MKAHHTYPFASESVSEIKEQVNRLLIAAGVGDTLPTPKKDIIECSDLVKIGKLDLSAYKEGMIEKGLGILRSAISKIKGFLDYRERIIYVDPEVHPSRETFITYHEVTHDILPWHDTLFNPHIDTDFSLDSRLVNGLEAEANLGASLIQFQIDRLSKDAKALPLGLGSAIHLSQRYGTSYHSTFRKYVEDNRRACALLIFKPLAMTDFDNKTSLELWYPRQSKKFTDQFGDMDWPKFYSNGHPIFDIVYEEITNTSLELISKGEMDLSNGADTKKKCCIECFSNTYNHFVLIYPYQKLRLKKTKVISRS